MNQTTRRFQMFLFAIVISGFSTTASYAEDPKAIDPMDAYTQYSEVSSGRAHSCFNQILWSLAGSGTEIYEAKEEAIAECAAKEETHCVNLYSKSEKKLQYCVQGVEHFEASEEQIEDDLRFVIREIENQAACKRLVQSGKLPSSELQRCIFTGAGLRRE